MTTDEPQGPPGQPGEAAQAGRTAPLQGAGVIAAVMRTLPREPGVYRMLDAAGAVLYVGKARDLRRRVSAYTKPRGHEARILRMIAATASMEIITTGSEVEALLLEASLIKRLKPRFNIILRDDKSFAEILVTADHRFPQILKHRGARSRKGRYFGPFASAGAVNRTLNVLQRVFLLRSCSDAVFEARTRPCLLHQIRRCSAPCVGLIGEAAYGELVAEARDFLEGRNKALHAELSQRMEKAAEALDFESAALYRDRLRSLSAVLAHQGVHPETVEDADVIAASSQGGQTCVQVFFYRGGQNWGNRAYFPRHDRTETPSAVLGAFLAQFYDDRAAPPLVLLSHDLPERALLAEALAVKAGHAVALRVPERGEKRRLLGQALDNAREALGRRLAESTAQSRLLAGLAEAFGLPEPPRRIEVYDNSHMQGSHALGAMIVAGPEGFQKSDYRRFTIRAGAGGGDDYAMMREVLGRRFARLVGNAEGADRRPDLVLLDGGAGQLSAAREVLAALGLSDITLLAIAKGEDRHAGRERFFLPGREPFMLEAESPVLYYLQRLRDEAHRFAIGGHRAKRSRSIADNPLDEIEGIGPARKRALLHHFGSGRAVARAGLADLQAVPGVSRRLARKVYEHFHPEA